MNQDRKPESYESALAKAWNELGSLDPMDSASLSGASYDPEKKEFTLLFFGEEYHIQKSNKTVKDRKGREVKPFMVVLLLHYLIYAKNIEPTGKLITFRELVGGDVYYDAFQRRAILPLTKIFGSDINGFEVAAKNIGATEGTHGDISFIIEVFPKIPVTVILWEGDEEVPPSSNMLFDESIRELLPTEDVAVIGGFVASVLIKNKPDTN